MKHFYILAAFLMLILPGSLALAQEIPPCPECPRFCVPEGFVETQKATLPENLPTCPPGCLPLGAIKSLLDAPRCRFSLEAETPPEMAQPAVETPKTEEIRNESSTRHRLMYTQTALGVEKGQTTITGYLAAVWDFQYGLHDNVQLGVVTILPISVFGLLPTFKFHGKVNDFLHLSIGGFGGMITTYVASVDFYAWVAGGQAAASFVFDNHLFNLSFTSFTAGKYEDRWRNYDGAVLIPALGYRYGFHRDWSFQTNLSPAFFVESGRTEVSRIWLWSYGFRGHGEVMYGDIGFTMPLHKDFFNAVWKYLPLGIPYVSLGFHF